MRRVQARLKFLVVEPLRPGACLSDPTRGPGRARPSRAASASSALTELNDARRASSSPRSSPDMALVTRWPSPRITSSRSRAFDRSANEKAPAVSDAARASAIRSRYGASRSAKKRLRDSSGPGFCERIPSMSAIAASKASRASSRSRSFELQPSDERQRPPLHVGQLHLRRKLSGFRRAIQAFLERGRAVDRAPPSRSARPRGRAGRRPRPETRDTRSTSPARR